MRAWPIISARTRSRVYPAERGWCQVGTGFGDCHPGLVLIVIELTVVGLLLTVYKRGFSNTLQLTAWRVGGLLAAGVNGMVAAYVTGACGYNRPCAHQISW